MAAFELPPDDFDENFSELLDGLFSMFPVKDHSTYLQDGQPQTDVDKVLEAEQRVKEWRAQTRGTVDQAREDLKGALSPPSLSPYFPLTSLLANSHLSGLPPGPTRLPAFLRRPLCRSTRIETRVVEAVEDQRDQDQQRARDAGVEAAGGAGEVAGGVEGGGE
jgi:hypothetical protein